jgi:hypothetical protein
MSLVTQYVATVPVSGDLYGDISRSVLAVADAMGQKGYLANAQPIQTGTSLFSGANQYGKVRFTLKKQGGGPFESDQAAADLTAASSAIGLKIANASLWALELVASATPDPNAISQAYGNKLPAVIAMKEQQIAACKAKGGWFCALQVAGIPPWVPFAAIGLASLYVLSRLADIKLAFLGSKK